MYHFLDPENARMYAKMWLDNVTGLPYEPERTNRFLAALGKQ
jgi:hypothetical protein